MSQLSKLITRKYMVAIIVVAILDTISFAAVLLVISLDKDYAYLINTSGRQRMLSQRIALHLNQLQHTGSEYHDSIKEDALQDIKIFEKAHLILSLQDPKVKHTISKKIIEFYRGENGLDSESRYFISRARQLLGEKEGSEELIRFTNFAKDTLLPHLNEAVSLFEQESDFFNKVLIDIQIIVYLFSFITLALILKLIFIPLRDSLVSREKELFKVVSKLKEEGQYKSTFLANMGHELRTPLNGILGMVDLLNGEENLTHEQLNLISIIEQSGKNLLKIVDDILEITQIEMKKVEFREKDFNPETMLNEVINDCFDKAKEKDIDFEWEQSTLPLLVRADEHKIKQIISHLLNNALKYTNEGSIKVVTIYDEITSQLTFKVHDTGIGIPEDKIETIFEPFKQVDSTATRLYGGTGLGLAISKDLAEAMGGSLKLSSELGIGTTFILTLPLNRIQSDITKKLLLEESEQSNEGQHRGSILLIDSDELNRNIMISIIGHMGPNVEAAISPRVGQRLSLTKNYQLALIKIPTDDKNFVRELEDFIYDFPKTTKIFLIIDPHKSELREELKRNPKLNFTAILEAPLGTNSLHSLFKEHLKS